MPCGRTSKRASSNQLLPNPSPDRKKLRKIRYERRVDRRKRLSHVDAQALDLLWGRRFRLPTNYFSRSKGGCGLGLGKSADYLSAIVSSYLTVLFLSIYDII